jgi:hypothetical protein
MVEQPPGKSNIPLQTVLFLYCAIVTFVSNFYIGEKIAEISYATLYHGNDLIEFNFTPDPRILFLISA